MAVYTSPGTYTEVEDLSQYAAPTSPTVAGIIGGARKGPIVGEYNETTKSFTKPTLITSPERFISTFGKPDANLQGPYAALLYLQQGNQLYYGRVAGSGHQRSETVIEAKLTVRASTSGEWGDEIGVKLDTGIYDSEKMKLTVYTLMDGAYIEREVFDGLDFDPDSPTFYETAINGKSDLIQVEYAIDQMSHPSPTPDVVPLSGGNDGAPIDDSDVVGVINDQGFPTGLQAFADKLYSDITLLAAPGYSSDAVTAAIQTICDNRGDCLGVLHGPLGLPVQDMIEWHNATGAYASTSKKVNSANCAIYWPWVEIYDAYNSKNMWVPPVGFALQKMAYTDKNAECWYAPAGIRRGRLGEALRVEYECNQGDRDAMYGPGNGNAINPIVNLPLDGITIYGQRTTQRSASALDRINVARLIHYATRVVSRACRTLEFEQNDTILWDQFINICEPFMKDIKAKRGCEEFKVIADESTTTAYRRNNNEMHGYILLIPTKSAEKIVIHFGLFPSGVQLGVPQIG